MTAFPKPCGRLDRHDEHEWTRPKSPFRQESEDSRTFACAGRVLLEGGYWADWDAADDAAEDLMDRERREQVL